MRQITGVKNWGGLPERDDEYQRHIKEMKTRERRARFDYTAFLARYWESDVTAVKFYDTLRECCGTNAQPWQDLRPNLRREFVKQLSERIVLSAFELSSVGQLEDLWLANNKELVKVRARTRDKNDDSEDAVLYSRSSQLMLPEGRNRRSTRRAAASFTIDYSRYTDREIVSAFADWLHANRPKRWLVPKNIFPVAQRGKKLNDYRVALERLAIMRLLHWYSSRFLRLELPMAWKLYGRKETTFRREIRGALNFYRERFPFLPKKEKPLSFVRYFTWLRPMLRSLDGDSKSATIS